jgi:hypothetical protein
MNIRQCRGISELAIQSFPYIVPASQVLFLAVGMRMPATDRRGLGTAKERSPVSNEDAERRRAERNAKRRARYLANREKELARVKAYREANREKTLAYAAAYWEANKEQVKASQKAYHAANREKRLAYMVAYNAARRAARKQPR